MEVIATVLALLVGVMALVRFYSKKDNTILFIGAGFLGTAFLDGYHALVTSTAFAPYLPSDLPALIPWSWVASRFFLSLLIFLSWFVWRWEKASGDRRIVQETHVYGLVAILTVLSFLFFAFAPLARAYYPEYMFGRPEEFVPGALFLVALIGYYRKGAWRHDIMEHWLMLALIVSVISQLAFMSLSFELFDFEFDMAHTLKKTTYVLVLTGLLFSMYATFKNAEEAASKVQLAVDKHLRAEVDARRSAENLKSIFDAVPDGIITTDKNGLINAFNPGAERLFGYDSEEVLGQNVKALMPQDVAYYHDDHMAKYRRGQGVTAIGRRREMTGLRKDGTTFPIDLTINNSRGDSDEEAVTGIVRDITSQKLAADELAQYVEELAKSNEELEQFAYVASHDLKAPLRGIDNLAGFIREDLGDSAPEGVDANFTLLQNRIKRMERLLDDLLEYSRAGRSGAESVSVDLNQEITDVVALLGLADGFEVDVNCPRIELNVARAPIHQVLMNIIGNAVKHHDCDTGTVSVDVSEDSDSVTISIADDGPGIPEEFHERVFKMFQTLKPRDELEGSGMGLAVVKKVIESVGGSISIHSTETTRGTRFTIRWPKRPKGVN
jgi:PAS domain S-box-containing protein